MTEKWYRIEEERGLNHEEKSPRGAAVKESWELKLSWRQKSRVLWLKGTRTLVLTQKR